MASLAEMAREFARIEREIRRGGGDKAIERQHAKGRLTARERIARLVDHVGAKGRREPADIDPHADEIPGFQELGLWAAHEMYSEFGGAPAAGVITGIGKIHGRRHMIIANDATVKAGAFFPMTCKKIIRAQHIARMARLPLVYLVDSAGVFLPLQEDVFPDTDDFGRIFYLNSVLSAEGVPQIAAIMGFCVAGGGYLPVLCDTLLMTEGSGLYLAGPALVKAAIGQEVSDEELGGAAMHAEISGTIDFKEPDDEACLRRVRELVGRKVSNSLQMASDAYMRRIADDPALIERVRRYQQKLFERAEAADEGSTREVEVEIDINEELGHLGARPMRDPEEIASTFTDKPGEQYDVKDIIACIVDARTDVVARVAEPGEGEAPHDSANRACSTASPAAAKRATEEKLAPDFDEYKADYGRSLVCGYARLGGHACGIVANQCKLTEQMEPGGRAGPSKSTNMPRVIYDEAAEKAARFIMDCNQRRIPLIFLHDTTGFMVGRDSEQAGIIRAGAKMVNAMSNCVVPKIVVIMGSSYGAGNYAMCGRAFEPFLTFAWPGSKCAVMGAAQASGTLAMIEERSLERKGEQIDPETHKQILDAVRASYSQQQDIRHGAARGWVDRIIDPARTREELIAAIAAAEQGWDYSRPFKTGVLQT